MNKEKLKQHATEWADKSHLLGYHKVFSPKRYEYLEQLELERNTAMHEFHYELGRPMDVAEVLTTAVSVLKSYCKKHGCEGCMFKATNMICELSENYPRNWDVGEIK